LDSKEILKEQKLKLDSRTDFTVDGVMNVERFTQNEVLLKTVTGGLRISGDNFKLEDLSKENGEIFVSGKIDGINFEDIKEKRSFFKDMFR